MDKTMSYIKKYRLETIYIIILLLMIIENQSPSNNIFIVKGVLVGVLWLMPYFLNLKFKIVNTVILSISISSISATLFMTDGSGPSSVAVILIIMLFVALVLNIFAVIKELYQLRTKNGKKRNGLKLVYVLLSFGLLIGTVVYSYAHIYRNINASDASAFVVSNNSAFSELYFSCTTYFTVGYGDIVPISEMARNVSMSQMVFGYVITCLILPTTLVAFQKLFYEKTKL